MSELPRNNCRPEDKTAPRETDLLSPTVVNMYHLLPSLRNPTKTKHGGRAISITYAPFCPAPREKKHISTLFSLQKNKTRRENNFCTSNPTPNYNSIFFSNPNSNPPPPQMTGEAFTSSNPIQSNPTKKIQPSLLPSIHSSILLPLQGRIGKFCWGRGGGR